MSVEEILSWYDSENPGVIANLYRLLNSGRLAGTGKLVVLPVDQGFEHGPSRSFAPNPPGYDPHYHPQLALDAGCNAYAAPLGQLRCVAREYAGRLPLILKANNADSLYAGPDPVPAVTAGVADALEIGATAIGFTIYPGSAGRNDMYQELRAMIADARRHGLAVVVWSYPRGSGVSQEGRTAVDTVAYAAQIAAQLGAHVIKVKPPTAHIENEAAAKALTDTPLETLADRVREVIRGAFNGRRIVIFSGGPAKDTAAVLAENEQTAQGGGFGTIMGRNSFQRPRDEAIELLHAVMDIHANSPLIGPSTTAPFVG